MRFNIPTNRDKEDQKKNSLYNKWKLPIIEDDSKVCLFTFLTDFTSLLGRNMRRNKEINGIIYHDHCNFRITDATIMMLYCDRMEHYRQMYDMADANNDPYIIIKNSDLKKVRYKLKIPTFNFQEQKYIIENVSQMVYPIIKEREELDAELAKFKIKLQY